MNDRRDEDRIYTAVVLAFLAGLVGLGLLGIPALLVAAIGAVVAVLGIVILNRLVEGDNNGARSRRGGRGRAPAQYSPSVLEGSRVRRRRIVHLRRHRHASPPLRFR